MGSGSSKQTTAVSAPAIDLASAATVSLSAAQEAQQQIQSALKQTTEAVKYQTGQASWFSFLVKIVGFIAVALLGIVLYDTFAPASWPNILYTRHTEPSEPTPIPQSEILYITYAHYGTDNTSNYKDVTQHVTSMIVGETTLPPFSVSWSNLGLSSDPYPGQAANLYIEYYVGTGAYAPVVTVAAGAQTPQIPDKTSSTRQQSSGPVAAPPPSFASRVYNAIFGDSSGDLAPSYHDASSAVTIQGNRAPLSSQNEGGYGMQWWMYVKDWNYGYGKKKSVVKRPDATNSSVMNPHIALHPTDNSLQISVSVFPATEGGASKSTPAPAGHSGSTDDVFVCEVPNIPLQTWFSVSVTVFGRNLDVYIDGKLVKSCFLTGVPKPAVGDIQLTPEGGFSGRICGFYHYPRMLTPSDAQTFYNAGTSCKGKTESGIGGKATGYSVKFGVYDSLGKEVQEYAF